MAWPSASTREIQSLLHDTQMLNLEEKTTTAKDTSRAVSLGAHTHLMQNSECLLHPPYCVTPCVQARCSSTSSSWQLHMHMCTWTVSLRMAFLVWHSGMLD